MISLVPWRLCPANCALMAMWTTRSWSFSGTGLKKRIKLLSGAEHERAVWLASLLVECEVGGRALRTGHKAGLRPRRIGAERLYFLNQLSDQSRKHNRQRDRYKSGCSGKFHLEHGPSFRRVHELNATFMQFDQLFYDGQAQTGA
jgi:hypothetical protein